MSEQKFNKYKYLDYLNNGPDGDMLYYTFYRFNNNLGALVTSDYTCTYYNFHSLTFQAVDSNIHKITRIHENIDYKTMIVFLHLELEFSK